LPQDQPSCEGGEDHQWDEGPTYGGPGATLVWVDTCRTCGIRRETTRYPADRGRRLFKVSYST
jgi:sugar lactone lactonase YvrE